MTASELAALRTLLDVNSTSADQARAREVLRRFLLRARPADHVPDHLRH